MDLIDLKKPDAERLALKLTLFDFIQSGLPTSPAHWKIPTTGKANLTVLSVFFDWIQQESNTLPTYASRHSGAPGPK